MGALQHNRRRAAGEGGLLPAQCANAPAVARFQPLDVVLWTGCDQVVATFELEIQERHGHPGTDDVAGMVVRVRADAMKAMRFAGA
jgi:hypothetical protein